MLEIGDAAVEGAHDELHALDLGLTDQFRYSIHEAHQQSVLIGVGHPNK